jgi:hypothetical protein
MAEREKTADTRDTATVAREGAGANAAAPSPLPPVFHAVVSTVVPAAAQLDDSGWQQVDELVLASLRQRPDGLRRKLRLFLTLIEWLPALRYGKPFTSLDAERRRLVLSRLQQHPVELIRVGFWGVRTLALLGYYGRDAAARAIGYRPRHDGWDAFRP